MLIEEFPETGGRKEEEVWREYDPACERLDVAIKAIWLLYRRARWAILEDLTGMERCALEPIFVQFDMLHISSDHGRIRSDTQVFTLLRMFNQEVEEEKVVNRHKKIIVKRKINPLLGAAAQLVADYEWIYRKARGRRNESSGDVADQGDEQARVRTRR